MPLPVHSFFLGINQSDFNSIPQLNFRPDWINERKNWTCGIAWAISEIRTFLSSFLQWLYCYNIHENQTAIQTKFDWIEFVFIQSVYSIHSLHSIYFYFRNFWIKLNVFSLNSSILARNKINFELRANWIDLLTGWKPISSISLPQLIIQTANFRSFGKPFANSFFLSDSTAVGFHYSFNPPLFHSFFPASTNQMNESALIMKSEFNFDFIN